MKIELQKIKEYGESEANEFYPKPQSPYTINDATSNFSKYTEQSGKPSIRALSRP